MPESGCIHFYGPVLCILGFITTMVGFLNVSLFLDLGWLLFLSIVWSDCGFFSVLLFGFQQELDEKSFNRRFYGEFDVQAHYISGVDWHEAERVLKPLILEKDVAGFSKIFWQAIRRENWWLTLLEGAYDCETVN